MTKTLSALVLAAVLTAAAPAYALSVDVGASVNVGSTATTSTTVDATSSATAGTVDVEISLPTQVSSDADVTVYSESLVKSDANMGPVETSAEEVSVRYKERLHLFGFIPVWGTVKSTVRADGTVVVQYPWYSFLSSTSRAEVESRVQNSVDAALKDRVEATGSFSARTQAGLIAAMRAALKTSYEADVAAETSADVK